MPFISRKHFNAIVTHCMLPIEIALQRNAGIYDPNESVEAVANGDGIWQQESALGGPVDEPWKRFEWIYKEFDWVKVHDFHAYLTITICDGKTGILYEPKFNEMKIALETGVHTYIYHGAPEVCKAANEAGFPDHNLEDMTDLCEQVIDTVRWIHNNIIREQEA